MEKADRADDELLLLKKVVGMDVLSVEALHVCQNKQLRLSFVSLAVERNATFRLQSAVASVHCADPLAQRDNRLFKQPLPLT